MTDLERLLALEDIRQLKARYFRCMDMKDWAGFEAVFTPDAKADYTPAGAEPERWVATGAANISAWVQGAVGTALTVHHGHMPEIELTSPTTARGIWSMEDLLRWPEGSPRKPLHGMGHYHETYEKLDGKWLIKTLRLTRLRVDES